MAETKRRPGPAPKLSREAVLNAARDLPPDDITLAAIGARLGVTSPALYRYFADRGAIVEALANEAREQLAPPDPELPWEEWLREAARRERALWRARPGLAQASSYRAVAGPVARMTKAGLEVLMRAGFSPEDAIGGLTIASEVAHAIGFAETRTENVFSPEDVAELRALLNRQGTIELEAVFEQSLTIAIDGLRAQLAGKKRRRR